MNYKELFKIRTITCFLKLDRSDFPSNQVKDKVTLACQLLQHIKDALQNDGYNVQTLRLAMNPFNEYLTSIDSDLKQLEEAIAEHDIDFCSLGSASSPSDLRVCRTIVASSPRFSCSANLKATDVVMAKEAARCILDISKMGSFCSNGLGNFRFCIGSCQPYIPFFPAARSASDHDGLGFALGLENGELLSEFLVNCKSLENIPTMFKHSLTETITPLQTICETVAKQTGSTYYGIDTSLNPSLNEKGSVAAALEKLDEVDTFGGSGTLATVAAMTQAIQSLPGISRTGYCGLMLPLCEDRRLAQLSSEGRLRVADLLSISSVCGVGVDTVPICGSTTEDEITRLLLDVVGIAERWNKSLSCRIFPVPGSIVGDMTSFNSPYMVNTRILSLSNTDSQADSRN